MKIFLNTKNGERYLMILTLNGAMRDYNSRLKISFLSGVMISYLVTVLWRKFFKIIENVFV